LGSEEARELVKVIERVKELGVAGRGGEGR